MVSFNFDLLVLGAGSAGIRAARIASKYGAKVAIIENSYLGGTCINAGCVPKKLMMYAAQLSDEFRGASGLGWISESPIFNWAKFVANKKQEINRLHSVYQELLDNGNITLIEGKGHIVGPHTLEVGKQSISSKCIVVATGAKPNIPDFIGNHLAKTSNDMFKLEQLPKQILILGGGYIGIEFAGIMNGLGVTATLCQRSHQLLRRFDDDIGNFIKQEMIKKGIQINFGVTVQKIEKQQSNLKAYLSNGQEVTTELVLLATGRTPNTSGFGLEDIGVKLDKQGAIKVNANFQTNLPSIYALGDVINRVNLTPVATKEAMLLAEKLFGNSTTDMDYENIPTAVFSQPNIASVGLSETEAKSKYNEIDTYQTTFKPMKHNLTNSNELSFMKLVVVRSTDKVVGIHMVGPEAGEIIQGMAVAIKAGATKAMFDSTIGIHPTAAEEFVSMR